MYFEQFPTFSYPFDINGKRVFKRVTDITVNVRVRKAILDTVTVYDEYDIQDGETAEIIAEKAYGSPLYHWVVMLINDKYDYIEDFPLPQYEFDQYLRQKYGTVVNLILTADTNSSMIVTVSSTAGLQVGSLINYVDYYYTKVLHTVRVESIDSITQFTVNMTIDLLRKGSDFVIDPVYGLHHYVNLNGYIVDDSDPNATPISNYDYEMQVNENKRRIKLISNANLFRLLAQFKNLV